MRSLKAIVEPESGIKQYLGAGKSPMLVKRLMAESGVIGPAGIKNVVALRDSGAGEHSISTDLALAAGLPQSDSQLIAWKADG